jgi:hypothetical protein
VRIGVLSHRLQPQNGGSRVPVLVGGSGIGAFRWSTEGKEIANVTIAGRSSVGLSQGDFENWSNMSNPAFQAWTRELQSVLQREGLVD